MKRTYTILIVVVALSILLAGFFGITAMLITKHFGTKVTAIVVKLPLRCGNRSEITVEYNQQQYRLSISSANCRMGVYQVGQQIPVMYHRGLNTVVFPNIGIELFALIMIFLLTLIYFQYRSSLQKDRDQEKNSHQQGKAT